jgi:DNA-directed RNA polymerase specialized sigma24 family protein
VVSTTIVYSRLLHFYRIIRTSPPARGDLKPWLLQQIKSEISNLFHSSASKRETELEREDGQTPIDSIEYGAVEDVFENIPDVPEASFLKKERKREKIEALYEAMEGEQELEDICYAILDGCERQPRFLAAELGVPVSEVNNRLKRLCRRAITIKQRLENDSGQ